MPYTPTSEPSEVLAVTKEADPTRSHWNGGAFSVTKFDGFYTEGVVNPGESESAQSTRMLDTSIAYGENVLRSPENQ